MKKSFLFCGLIGWGMEILWTGAHSFFSGDLSMMGKSSILMFPIYGCASIIKPLYNKLREFPFFVRGCIYTSGFYIVEYFTGRLFQYFHIYPWDYSKCLYNYKGVIRFDYLPLWFLVGLIFEKILLKSS